MKHVVFVLGSYYPNFSAVGACAHNVIDAISGDFRVSVVSLSTEIREKSRDQLSGIEIVRVSTRERARRLELSSAMSPLGRVLLKLHRARYVLGKIFSRVTVDRELVEAYLQALKSLEVRPDVVVPLVFPMEAALAAIAYKRCEADTIVCPYLFDDFVESRSLHVIQINRLWKERRHIALERSLIDQSDCLLAMRPLRSHLEGSFGSAQMRKVRFVEHPLLVAHTVNRSNSAEDELIVSYMGSLIENVREPDYLLEMLQIASFASPVRFDFYVMGSNAYKIKSMAIDGSSSINNCGRVNRQCSLSRMMCSNVLLNLGEIRGVQISSKVFEYISAGKPIVHLAYVKDDAVSRILERYPLALCLLQDRVLLKTNAQKCAEFIDQHKHSSLSFAEVAELYPEALPSTTADLMRQIFLGEPG